MYVVDVCWPKTDKLLPGYRLSHCSHVSERIRHKRRYLVEYRYLSMDVLQIINEYYYWILLNTTLDTAHIMLLSIIVCIRNRCFSPHRLRMSVSYSEAGMNVPPFRRFRLLLGLRWPHESSSKPPGRPSPREVEASGYGSGRSKRKGWPRIEKRGALEFFFTILCPANKQWILVLQDVHDYVCF